VSFFICQPHFLQHDIDGLQRTPKAGRRPQLLQGEIALLGQQSTQLSLVGVHNHRLAPGKVMPGRDVAGAPPLLQQLLNHAQRDPETVRNLGASPFLAVIGKKNTFTEIQGERSHESKLTRPYFMWLHYLLKRSNNFDLPPLSIAQLYKCRWQVELFFKWIKQNLRIKHFFGTTDNAVKTQVWIAICVYVLVAIVRKELRRELSLSQILQILSVNAFEQIPLAALVAKAQPQDNPSDSSNQLMFWN